MKTQTFATLVLTSSFFASSASAADLIAIGTISGTYQDFASETDGPLENGSPGNVLGGIGSGLAYAGGTTFLALLCRIVGQMPFHTTRWWTIRFPTFRVFRLCV
jgi:hypothetical protein